MRKERSSSTRVREVVSGPLTSYTWRVLLRTVATQPLGSVVGAEEKQCKVFYSEGKNSGIVAPPFNSQQLKSPPYHTDSEALWLDTV